MNEPYIKIWKNKDINYPIIEPASIQREFLDNTYNKIGYNCAPMTLANQHGWWFKLPQDVVIRWNGKRNGIDGEDVNNIEILSGEYFEGYKIVTNESGVGQVTFKLNCNIETDENHYLIFSGPPNFFHEDAKPLEVIWRSDFYNYHEISFNWIPTTPNKDILFPKGMPILFIKNYPKDLLNSTDIFIENILNNKELIKDSYDYNKQRSEWFKEHDTYDFRNFYRNGIGPGYEKKIQSPVKLNLKRISILDNNVE